LAVVFLVAALFVDSLFAADFRRMDYFIPKAGCRMARRKE
jgi:hypothetical protein